MQTDYMLAGAEYDGTDPEMLAAHDRVFYEYMWSGGDDGVFAGKAGALVDALYRDRRPEILELEKQAQARKASERSLPSSAEPPGTRILEFLHVMRHCIFVWIVTTTASPRDRFGYIAAARTVKRDLCAAEFVAHLAPILNSPEYAELAMAVRAAEDEELAMGTDANKGEDARGILTRIGTRNLLVHGSPGCHPHLL